MQIMLHGGFPFYQFNLIMYFIVNSTKKFLCNIDLIITMELRIFEYQQFAMIELIILFCLELHA